MPDPTPAIATDHLRALVDPAHTAVLTMEIQVGVVEGGSPYPELVAAVEATDLIANVARLLAGARDVGATVVHCLAAFRADRRGRGQNAPMLRYILRHPDHLVEGTPPTRLVAGLGPEPGDLVHTRTHGVSPFTATDLDGRLRNLDVRTVVATGVSLNVGILGLAIEAVNLGYQVVCPEDAVAAAPADAAEGIWARTLAMLAWRTTVDDVLAAWTNELDGVARP